NVNKRHPRGTTGRAGAALPEAKKEASKRASPDRAGARPYRTYARIARERVPPMGVVKRGLWAQRLFHFFKCDGVALFAVMRKVFICLNALLRGLTRLSRRTLPLQSPSNPNRATRSGVEEKNGISAEGRSEASYAGFFLPLRYALRHPSHFSV